MDSPAHRGDPRRPPDFCRYAETGASFSQCARELAPRVELQLAEDAREVALDRACGDEQRLCDLAVGEALAGELGDAALAGRQRVEPREHDPARARTGGAELGLRLLARAAVRPRGGRRRALRGEALAPRCGGCAAEAGRRGRRGHARSSRLASPRSNASIASRSRDSPRSPPATTAGRTLRHAERARSAECPGELELLVCEASCRLAVAEREMGDAACDRQGR